MYSMHSGIVVKKFDDWYSDSTLQVWGVKKLENNKNLVGLGEFFYEKSRVNYLRTSQD